jgi:pyridoxal phosphate enzyme (YggS family)
MNERVGEDLVERIKINLDSVKKRIAESAAKVGRDPAEIKLVAVTKLMPKEVILAGVEAGICCFGENYPEQAAEKIASMDMDEEIEWHMIGHIQSRKADTVCKFFDMVHSLDRMKIARYLDRYANEQNRIMPVLLEVNLSGEESKYGWDASSESSWRNLLGDFQKILGYKNIQVRGLMTMPPFYEDPEKTRPIYRELRRLKKFLQERIPEANWDELSIGTSFDFPVAVEEGATIVRIGTEIFGPRSMR